VFECRPFYAGLDRAGPNAEWGGVQLTGGERANQGNAGLQREARIDNDDRDGEQARAIFHQFVDGSRGLREAVAGRGEALADHVAWRSDADSDYLDIRPVGESNEPLAVTRREIRRIDQSDPPGLQRRRRPRLGPGEDVSAFRAAVGRGGRQAPADGVAFNVVKIEVGCERVCERGFAGAGEAREEDESGRGAF
jgi:hypothetical protein